MTISINKAHLMVSFYYAQFDFSEILAFISVLQSGEFLEEASIDLNGVVDVFDIAAFIGILLGT